eukprot:CAMPEP_0174384538 /NCGR_PEP_ID=MMETSP0811_2-20130205/125988_1 /TAXON_ID=73025 ORGANISM="Eutreptiella gymnastica-like, Strain CCMP1594" /NCGR_SAMPLE_ID=MMETSP0811_2 /ASSEMBLY_ACC=CAM_ASM_000667 /LENGTH=98 /DNA_ID=CAMNT_0015538529 /DNA_START=1035 /DNA_END=1328 /DNA_ORIENTATION=+
MATTPVYAAGDKKLGWATVYRREGVLLFTGGVWEETYRTNKGMTWQTYGHSHTNYLNDGCSMVRMRLGEEGAGSVSWILYSARMGKVPLQPLHTPSHA